MHSFASNVLVCASLYVRRHSFACNVYAQLCQQRTRVCIPVCSQAQLCLQCICTALPATYSCVHPCMFTGTALLATYMHSFASNVLVCASLYVHRHSFASNVLVCASLYVHRHSFACNVYAQLCQECTCVCIPVCSQARLCLPGLREEGRQGLVRLPYSRAPRPCLHTGRCSEKLWQTNSWLPVGGGMEDCFLRKPVPRPCTQGRWVQGEALADEFMVAGRWRH